MDGWLVEEGKYTEDDLIPLRHSVRQENDEFAAAGPGIDIRVPHSRYWEEQVISGDGWIT